MCFFDVPGWTSKTPASPFFYSRSNEELTKTQEVRQRITKRSIQKQRTMSSQSNNTLFLVGGTGGLGSEVAKGRVTAEGFSSRKALVRSAEKAQHLVEMG